MAVLFSLESTPFYAVGNVQKRQNHAKVNSEAGKNVPQNITKITQRQQQQNREKKTNGFPGAEKRCCSRVK